jgi:hypothetical protein
MNRIFTILLTVITLVSFQGRGQENPEPGKGIRFHTGISYSFFQTGYKVTALSAHSVWQGMDLGTTSLDDDELASLNEYETNSVHLNQVMISAGAVLLNSPQGKWFIDGNLLVGLSSLRSETALDLPTKNKMKVQSDLTNPVIGIGFNFRYNFTPRWGISLLPEFSVLWGSSKSITDSINPMVPHFSNVLKENYTLLYGRITPMISFSVSPLTVSAGPGFYYAFDQRTYRMERTDPETGKTYFDEIESSLCSRNFIDGCLRIDWTIIDPLTFSVEAAMGADLLINTGLRYNFKSLR